MKKNLEQLSLIPLLNLRTNEIVGEDLVVGEAVLAHVGGTDLAKADTVTPAAAGEGEDGATSGGVGIATDVEVGTVEVRLGESLAD